LSKPSIHYRITEHLEHARMYAGDLLRLAVLKEKHREPGFFDVGKHGGRYNDSITDFSTAADFINWAKKELRELLYYFCDHPQYLRELLYYFCDHPQYVPHGANIAEMNLYHNSALQHLKEADQCLGLWLGEIHEQEKQAPPSNAKEASPHLSYFQALEKQSEKVDNEQLFNAIMADLGEPRKMGGVKGPWSYLETIDLMDKNMADGVFGYSKSTIEATLRKHLGLPIVNPKS
jgi:hypothetical protein